MSGPTDAKAAQPAGSTLENAFQSLEGRNRADNPRKFEQIVARRDELYRTVIESLAEGILITNAEGRIVYANSRLEEITGYKKEELIGMVGYHLFLPEEQWPVMEQ